MLLLTVDVVALVLTGLLAGLHISGIGGLNPALRSLDGATYLAVKRAADVTFPTIARPLMLGSLLATGILVVVALISGDALVTALAVVTLLSLVATLAAILRGDLPINRIMSSWTSTTMPADWEMVRARWEGFFRIRMLANTVALAALVAAVFVAS